MKFYDYNGYKNISMDYKKKIDEAVNELKKFSPRILSWNEPVDPELMRRFESRFEVKLPEDYKYFLSITNGFSLMGDEVLGMFDAEKKYDLFMAYQIEHFEVIVPQYRQLIPFSPDGGGNFYCFDTRVETNCGHSNQIVFWYSNYEYNESDPPEITHQSLADFIKNWIIAQALDRSNNNNDEKPADKDAERDMDTVGHSFILESPNENKIDRNLLIPPLVPGQAPVFKEDGTPVELHYERQGSKLYFKEMHWREHRGKDICGNCQNTISG